MPELRPTALLKRLGPKSGSKAGAAQLQDADVPVFSYSDPSFKIHQQIVIKAIETVTGQPRLRRLYMEHYRNPVPDEDFWSAAVRKLELKLDYDEEKFQAIPKEGPLVIVANHPFGVLDGIVISYLTSRIRPRFKVLTNSVLFRAQEVRPFLLPIDFNETKAALETNLESRRQALAELREGGAVVVFPGGTVSTAKSVFGRAVDPEWKTFTSKLITSAKADVVPMFFEGQNSRLFQFASQVSQTLRYSLLFREVADRIGSEIGIRIGNVIPYGDLAHITDRKALMEHLRDVTYDLGEGHDPQAKRPPMRKNG
jgi:putative hemolysin